MLLSFIDLLRRINMSGIGSHTVFNPLTDSLLNGQRLRIKKGSLYVEDESVRRQANCLSRLFTRQQYSQKGILKIFKQAVEHSIYDHANSDLTILKNNYQFLIQKAGYHNDAYGTQSPISRFFYAKRLVKLSVHDQVLRNLNQKIATQNPNQLEKFWEATDSSELDKNTSESPAFGNLNTPHASDLAKLINITLKPEEAQSRNTLQELLELMGLKQVKDCIAKNIDSPEAFLDYIEQNKIIFKSRYLCYKFWDVTDPTELEENTSESLAFGNLNTPYASDLAKLIKVTLRPEQAQSTQVLQEMLELMGLKQVKDCIAKNIDSREAFINYIKQNEIIFKFRFSNACL